MSALGMSRRGLAGFLGFAAAVPAIPRPGSPDARLELALAALMEAEREFAALPDDGPRGPGLIARMDTLLIQAAMIRPVTDRGYAVKARIARVYSDCPAGETVERMLLSDLMIRGRMPPRAPTEQDMLDAYRRQSPEGRAAIDRFVLRQLAGGPFAENLAQLGREMPA